MKNKGFTLIELLAVIVILAIIALIAVPIVINIINESRESSYKRSIDNYGKAVEQAIANHQINNPNEKVVGVYKTGDTREKLIKLTAEEENKLNVNYDGSQVSCKRIIVYENGNIYMDLCSVGEHNIENYSYGTYQQIYKPKETANSTQHNIVYVKSDSSSGPYYLCFEKDEIEYCLKGKDAAAYETNLNIVYDAFADSNVNCSYSDIFETSKCEIDLNSIVKIELSKEGSVIINTNPSSDGCSISSFDVSNYQCYD